MHKLAGASTFAFLALLHALLLGFVTTVALLEGPNFISLWPSLETYETLASTATNDLWTSSAVNDNNPRNSSVELVGALAVVFGLDTAFAFVSTVTAFFCWPLTIFAIYRSFGGRELPREVPRLVFIGSAYLLLPLLARIAPLNEVFWVAGYGYDAWPAATAQALSLCVGPIAVLASQSASKVMRMGGVILFFIAVQLHFAAAFSLLAIVVMGSLTKGSDNSGSSPPKIRLELITSAAFSLALIGVRGSENREGLTAPEFAEIYAHLRHPWHFVPSEYLSWNAVALYIFAFGAFAIIKKVRKFSLMVLGLLLIGNLAQFMFVEQYPIYSVVALGPSRINIMLGPTIIALFMFATGSREVMSRALISPKIPLAAVTALLSVLSMLGHTTAVLRSIESLRVSVQESASRLQISVDDLVAVGPRVSTLGWRSFASASIYLDTFFPFNLGSIAIYRDRWLTFCDEQPLSDCSMNFSALPSSENLTIVVIGADHANRLPEKFCQVATYGDLASWKLCTG